MGWCCGLRACGGLPREIEAACPGGNQGRTGWGELDLVMGNEEGGGFWRLTAESGEREWSVGQEPNRPWSRAPRRG